MYIYIYIYIYTTPGPVGDRPAVEPVTTFPDMISVMSAPAKRVLSPTGPSLFPARSFRMCLRL